jgi:hypothetical protein
MVKGWGRSGTCCYSPTVRLESRCALIKSVGSDVNGSAMRRLDITTHNPKGTATFRMYCEGDYTAPCP